MVHYPHWEADVVLRDGTPMHIRPIRPEDSEALQRMHMAQSEQSRYFRYFAPMERLSDRDLHRFTHVDHVDRVALVLTGEDEEIRAVGRFDVVAPGTAEVAFNVADTEQGRGLGSVLLEHLTAAARERGVFTFLADVLPANARMIRVFTDAGYEISQHLEDGVISVSFSTAETERSWRVMAERERHAEALSMKAVLAASSVVVVRLSAGQDGDHGRSLAGAAAAGLLAQAEAGIFTGPIHLVGLPAWHRPTPASVQAESLTELSASHVSAEIAVVAGQPADVVEAVPRLAALGVRAMVVVSDGFGEAGAAGMARQGQLLRAVRAAGIRLVGPASYGVIGAGEAGRYDLTLFDNGAVAEDSVERGIGLFCQSAPGGRMLLTTAARRGLPLASFLSSGLRADVSGNDSMQFWSTHDPTAVGAVYLESIGNPRKFSRIARRLAADKPLVAVVSGQTGQATPPGHAVRTSQQPQSVLTELLRQAGIVRARSLREMLDVAGLLLAQPLPRGPRLAVVSTSGALASQLRDIASAHDLEPAGAPILLGSFATAADYARALEDLGARADWDAVVIAHAPPVGETDPAIARAVATAAARDERPWVMVAPGLHGLDPTLTAEAAMSGERTVPALATIEDAVRSLAGALGHARWRARAEDPFLDLPGIDPAAARGIIADRLQDLSPGGRVTLEDEEAAAVLASYGIAVLRSTVVADAEEAVAAARTCGYPVVLKTVSDALRHRADLGGVRLDLGSDDEVREAFDRLAERSRELLGREVAVAVQPQAPPGVACIIRGSEDDLYGPVVSFGLSGDASELLGDVSYRVPPLTAADVTSMIHSVRAAPRLMGQRGLPRADLDAVADLLSRVSLLTDDLPEIAEVSLNPVIAGPGGAQVAGFTVRIARPARQDAGRRALPSPHHAPA
ncbi:GNAT family N-acetyltransferase [Bogoriella caseilytica]|uniref:Acyl-CoA synthetase (NDP forming) n=1 Tax=Bogoriella caseilytica TaxID=56055 RepID=A0A3N2BG95_9MICO|nr:GNAT family N-acetyltransferase [Bogoriella caseilytica]ROR74279.1 acyl-CoA synthetase (NDP forming) [Bogoriella caseilytica]